MAGVPMPPPASGTGGSSTSEGSKGKPTVYGSSGRAGRFGTWSSTYAAELSGGQAPAQMAHQDIAVPFLDSLSTSAVTAHKVLASLSDQFLRATWAGTPIAVGVFRSGTEEQPQTTVVYATADGVSVCPYKVMLPSGVTPLSKVDGVGPRFLDSWNGVNQVADKLSALATDYPELLGELDVIVINESAARTAVLDDLISVQSADQRKQLVAAGQVAPVSRDRSEMSRVDGASSAEVLAQADMLFGGHEDAPEDSWSEEYLRRMARLWAARRSSQGPSSDYDSLLASYLLAEAHAALSEGRPGDAGYSLDELLSIEPVTA